MKVIDLHPEDLLDKEARGELTSDDRARLEIHLARCAACRFERRVRADFREEVDDEVGLSSQRLLALAEGIPGAANDDVSAKAPPPTELVRSAEHVPPTEHVPPANKTPSSRPARLRRRNTRIVLLVAAALFIGGVATAGAGARVWARVAATFSSPDLTPMASPSASVATSPKPSSIRAAVPAAVVKPTEIAAEPTIVAADPTVRESPRPLVTSRVPPAADPRLPPPGVSSASAPLGHAPPHAREISSAPPAVIEPIETASALFDTANEARRKGDYARAIFLHRRLQVTFPSSREAHVSYGTLGRLLLDRGDAAAALASFDSYQARGHGPLDEAVLVGRATALERVGRPDDARVGWSSLLKAFPDTPYAEHARTRAAGGAPLP
jgi:TolA-binding protein